MKVGWFLQPGVSGQVVSIQGDSRCWMSAEFLISGMIGGEITLSSHSEVK